ncbi:MAG: SDR family NAD(P)-dependent oxidoreductase [Pseudomonadales bacterium]|jgi:NAD(P)-dependent dehydrogenase (short-subunit alcohol dehydrogenase family)
MKDFENKVAFVSGAASGIGLGMVKALLAKGMQVMMADIEEEALKKAASALESNAVSTVLCDVSVRDAVFDAARETISTFGKIHVVCNNAGVSTGGLIDECDEGDWSWSLGVNLMGVIHGCQAFVPHLKAQGEGGHIVNTASMAGLLGRVPGWTTYNATKYAVVGMTESLYEEGKLAGFGASVLCPGAVRTRIYEAPRNRQDRFGPQVSKAAYTDISKDLAKGLDPDIVGDLVVEAIEAERLHILTDPRFEKMVAKRFARLAADFEWAANSKALTNTDSPGAAKI